MIVSHAAPPGWVDTNEADRIQPSEVAGLVHVVTLEPGDLLQGEPGPAGADGADGAQGPQGIQGPQGEPGPQGVAPAGAVLFFAMAAAPDGWLVCDGGLVSRAAYAALFAAIGTLYGVGDGATTFKLPDLRGEFIRGADGGRGVDAGRALGSAQADAFKSHTHSNGATYAQSVTAGGTGYYASQAAQSTGGAGGSETRPRNIALLPCISTGA